MSTNAAVRIDQAPATLELVGSAELSRSFRERATAMVRARTLGSMTIPLQTQAWHWDGGEAVVYVWQLGGPCLVVLAHAGVVTLHEAKGLRGAARERGLELPSEVVS